MFSKKKGFLFLFLLPIALLAAGSASLITVSAQAYENPHGPYGAFPAGCAACHVAHASPGATLLKQPTITSLCLACHDGTGSSYDVVNAVYAGFSSTCGAVNYHPVRGVKDLLGNTAVGETIECVHCHNPHGDPTVNGQVYPRLLNSSDGTNRYNEGPDFCLSCHGAVDRNFTGETDTYWEDTLGNHRNPNAAHYLTAAEELQPASGTKVTCVMCHNKHAAPNSRLLSKVEESLCWTCHVKEGDKLGTVHPHPVRAFSKTGSVHNVDGAGGSSLECSNCHGPHTANYMSFSVNEPGVYCGQCHNVSSNNVPSKDRIPYKLEGAYSVLSDPDNTKKGFSGAAGTGLGGLPNTVGDLSDFCIKCHDGSPPTAVATVDEFVPYTVVFPDISITTNSGGWNKRSYKSSAHGTASANITCGDCHESHGSDYPALQRYDEDTSTTDGECLRCHKSGGGAPDIRSDFLKSSAHPTLTLSGKHSNTENYALVPQADRHAECADCHDVHQATSGSPLRGVSGVMPTYGTTPWATPAYTFTKDADCQYEVCFKCHSYFSYGSSPPTSPSGGFAETDPSVEFNPNNPGYHAVVGISRVPSGYGKFVSPWTYDSPMKCTDCHGSAGSSVAGPHGSTEKFILKAPWNPDTGDPDATGKANTRDHLCFKCHDYDFYALGQGTGESKFSHGDCECKDNLHGGHHTGLGCASCHGSLPHGYKRRGILVVQGETPYDTGVKITRLSDPLRDPGTWRRQDCTTAAGCHGGQ
ncbi:MAG: cytochrome c3 family protein [Bacillota bacterium]